MITNYGFIQGPATVTRICTDPKLGAWLEVSGSRERIEIRVTKGGRVRVGPVIKKHLQEPLDGLQAENAVRIGGGAPI